MRYLKVLAAVALIGGTVAACTDDTYYGNRANYGASSNSRNVYGPGYSAYPAATYTAYPASTYTAYPAPAYTAYPASTRTDRDGDGVPNRRDRAPDNYYYR